MGPQCLLSGIPTTFKLRSCLIMSSFCKYGYHTSALNQLQAVLTCRIVDDTTPTYYGLPTCIPMSDATFSVVTSMFTAGGFFGSLFANIVMDRYGRKGASRLSAALTAAGAALFGLSSSVGPLILGRYVLPPNIVHSFDANVARFLVGLAAGLGICLCPIYLSEIAPARIRGNLGILSFLVHRSSVLIDIIRRFNTVGHRHRYHGHTSYGLWSRHSTTMAFGAFHISGDIHISVFRQPVYCRVSLLPQSKGIGRSTEISYPQAMGRKSYSFAYGS